MTASDNPFVRLAAINVNERVEKKGELSYLSWAWAVDQLLRHDPSANWEYHEPVHYGDTMMVSCTVTAFGIARRMHLPVMDYKNRAIANPDAFQVNTAMQRCLVKAIALHGLGLYIYAGEDLPAGAVEPERRPNTAKQVCIDAFEAMSDEEKKFLEQHAINIIAYCEAEKPDRAYGYLEEQRLTPDEQLALWSLLPSTVRTAVKKIKRTTEEVAA